MDGSTTSDNVGKRKRGGQAGNRNGLRHGLCASRATLSTFEAKQALRFRRALEDRVLSVFGEVSITKAALVHSASELQRLLFSNRRLLREAVESGGLTLDLRLRFDDQYAKLLDARDRKILALGIDREPDPFDLIFNRPAIEQPRHEAGDDATPADRPPADVDQSEPGDREGGVGHGG